jgi:plasmid stability protein
LPVNLSIKNAPDEIVVRLRARAVRNHRSLQGELLAILEAAALEDERADLSPAEVLALVRSAGSRTTASATRIVRRAREARGGSRRR